MVKIMLSPAKRPNSTAGLIAAGTTWTDFMTRVLARLAPCDNQPNVQSRGGLQVLDRVTIRREIRLGAIHIAPGEAGTVTAVCGNGRLLDVQFAAGAVTLHHLDVLPGAGSPGGKPLLARPNDPVHPHHLMRGKSQFGVGRV